MLPGFKLILGLGALFTADARQRAAEYNKSDQATPEGMDLFMKYLDIKNEASQYPDENWPRYRRAYKGVKTDWKRLAGYWNTSIHGLQIEYFEWKCEQLGIEFNYKLVLRAYHRDDLTAPAPGWHYLEYDIEPYWPISEKDDPRVKEDKEKKRKEEEAKRKAQERLNSPERQKLDDEIRARRTAVRAERLAREAAEKNSRR